ncbi:KN motif and ankyrin repeat domain-containing protein 4 [Tachysurus vachellii]|uniref:KN motif and ankyrin repeat domain-containing protein 4 n=1 Tax=Tachysurus vachellii TaxID=175792 RepID=UPI00296B3A1D|nr:KN motif and ankyrin repeat domain-containing protein 4 [Tachysurus vachellii]XP_060723555.1 KN motif and ankyrin repeat domain-containing protein 4 [Tachysurus vachellii]
MMDKKSANGFSTKASESGGQRKQLPYSVETPYGFHLDLDFLKYVDDIEKGNTIKRVHIQRKNRGPKYSTLPRNFSLPGHGARPVAKDTWSNTSTLGSKPKSRVTEVQQLFDFRASTDNASSSSSQSTPAAQSNVQGSSYLSSLKTVEQAHIQASQDHQSSLSLNVRPHLFRASSMPVNVPQRKASDATEEQSGKSQNGSTEKLFRPVDGSDRRGSIPQDRASLHQQITAALKRVRELEEQVRTIPELKAQICSLREEKQQLIQRIQTQSHVKSLSEKEPSEKTQQESQESTNLPSATKQQEGPSLPQDTVSDSHAKIPEIEANVDKLAQKIEEPQTCTALAEGPTICVVSIPVILIDKVESPTDSEGSEKMSEEPENGTEVSFGTGISEHGLEEQEEKPEKKDSDLTLGFSITEEKGDKSEAAVSRDKTEKTETIDQFGEKEKMASTINEQDVLTIQELQEKVKTLEERLRQVSCDLETTNSLLSVQREENRQKDVTIQELSEKVKEPIEDSVEQELKVPKETEPFPQHISTCEASVNTDSKHVLEKEVLTDIDLQPVDTIKEPDLICSSTQTNIVETREIEVLAQVMTSEKVVGVEIETCDQAVETDEYKNGINVKERKELEPAEELPAYIVDRDDVNKEKMNESMVIETDVAEEYVIVEKTEDDLVGTVPKDKLNVKTMVWEKELVENVTVVTETIKPDTSTDEPLQQDQKQPLGQDIQPQPQRPAEASASPAAIGQVVTRIQGLLNEQWASLGSGSQEPKAEGSQKQPVSKISSIQSHLRGSLSALSAFYSPVQKGSAAKQSGLKSIMKKNDCSDKQRTGGAKKNLKFVGVNGGYETTSSEESSGEENEDEREKEKEKEKEVEEEVEEEVDNLETEERGEERGVAPEEEKEAATAGEQAEEAQAGGSQGSVDPKDLQTGVDPQEEQPSSELVDKNFMAACHYLKDRMAEVSAPSKDMRQVLMVLYQEWFRVSSQKESQADTVTLYLREVGNHTPTLLRYIVNLADGNGNMALHYSVSHSNFQVVKLLLDTGLCEVDHQNKAGYTAIMLAALTAAEGPEDMEVSQHLLSLGNINAQAGQSGQTALMLAVSHARTAMVQVLLNCNADVNTQDQDGSTALMCACEHGHTEIAKLLLDRTECDTSLKDKHGHTALSLAIKFSHSELVDLLKAHAEKAGASHTSSLL